MAEPILTPVNKPALTFDSSSVGVADLLTSGVSLGMPSHGLSIAAPTRNRISMLSLE